MPILDWLDKDKAVTTAQKVPYRLLRPVPELSVGDSSESSGNMLIQGDNLEALKSLLPLYAGKVKCIYIDPPYNTKSAFFESYDDNLEHSIWLSMMYPRLELLWELLSPNDGVILISISDDEAHYLKVICDEIFGRSNFITALVWNYEGNTDNQAKIINYHEYILVYSKSGKLAELGVVDPNIEDGSKLNKGEIRNTVVKNGPKNPVSSIFLPAGFPVAFESGEIDVSNISWPKYSKNIKVDAFRTVESVVAKSGWSSKKILEKFISEGFSEVNDSKKQPTKFEITRSGAIEGVKRRESKKGHFLSVLRGLGTTNQMRIMLSKLGISFTYPKPIGLISYLLEAFTDEGDVVLDSFAGSGSTAHAVLNLNLKGAKGRKFVLVEMSSDNVQKAIVPRLQSVIFGNKKAGLTATGGGFNCFRLGEPVFDEYGHIREGVSFTAFAQYLWFLETGTPLTNVPTTPFLGEHNGVGYYLLYNGILGDRRPQGGNVLTSPILAGLPEFDGPKIIFGESSRLGDARLERECIQFKQIPYEVSGN